MVNSFPPNLVSQQSKKRIPGVLNSLVLHMQAPSPAIAHRRSGMPFRLPTACWKLDLPGMQRPRLGRRFLFNAIMKCEFDAHCRGGKHVSLGNIAGLFPFGVGGVKF